MPVSYKILVGRPEDLAKRVSLINNPLPAGLKGVVRISAATHQATSVVSFTTALTKKKKA